MISFKPGNTQIYSPFGTIVVEQRDRGFDYPRHSVVPESLSYEPSPVRPQDPDRGPVKAAA